jgi:hypothetical protein
VCCFIRGGGVRYSWAQATRRASNPIAFCAMAVRSSILPVGDEDAVQSGACSGVYMMVRVGDERCLRKALQALVQNR